MTLSYDDIARIYREVLLGLAPTLTTPDALAMRAHAKRDDAESAAKGHYIRIPAHVPNDCDLN